MKVKQWIKDHKKEIIVGAVAAGGTALYFMAKEKKIGVKAGINLSLRFLDGINNEEECFGWCSKSDLHTNINLNKPDLTLSDLGKLGDMLREKMSMISEDTKVNYLSANYRLLKK